MPRLRIRLPSRAATRSCLPSRRSSPNRAYARSRNRWKSAAESCCPAHAATGLSALFAAGIANQALQIEDQSHASVAQDRATRNAVDMLQILAQALDDHFLFSE